MAVGTEVPCDCMGLCGKMSSDLTRSSMMFFIAVTILARAFLIDSVPLTPVSYKVPELDDDIVYYYIGKSVPHRLGGLGTQLQTNVLSLNSLCRAVMVQPHKEIPSRQIPCHIATLGPRGRE